ncbi:MAG: 6-bladed beta-propeller [Vicinamibacterales bacterium]|jgi:DNA-binding beta-propeller fold protein YncE|nr:6-bladed beta-propeller [Vicinamibacterales bacterium]
MSLSRQVRNVLGVPAMGSLLLVAVACGGAEVEPAVDEAAPADMAAVLDGRVPINDLPNPYSSIDGWGKLPDGREWGSTAGVDIDPDGNLWAIDRCGSNSCAGSDLDPILKFDADGNVTAAIGGGLFLFPHGLHVDRDGNVWVTDARGPNPDSAGKGHVVIKLSPEGEVLLTLGQSGVAGDGTDALLNTPCDVVTAANGDIFVGDGHEGQNTDDPDTVARIVKFDSEGNFLASIGHWGAGPGEFKTPHALDIDSRGRLVVGDRGNNRLQVLDLDGNFIEQFKQYSRPSGIYIQDDDTIFVADSESAFDEVRNPGWTPAIRVGNLRDGSIDYLIDGTVEAYPEGSNPEGVAVDPQGNVYGAVVSGGGALVRSSKQEG